MHFTTVLINNGYLLCLSLRIKAYLKNAMERTLVNLFIAKFNVVLFVVHTPIFLSDFLNTAHNAFLFTESKDFLKSTNATKKIVLLCKCFCTSPYGVKMWHTVL